VGLANEACQPGTRQTGCILSGGNGLFSLPCHKSCGRTLFFLFRLFVLFQSWLWQKMVVTADESVVPLHTQSTCRVKKSRTWPRILKALTRTSVRGNVQPKIGQMCLIMTGVAGQDEGQMCCVTSTSKVMVEVSLVGKDGIGYSTKTKQPRSLVLLGPGLLVTQDANGSVWVRTSTDECETTKVAS
jgi:hypothetical protein